MEWLWMALMKSVKTQWHTLIGHTSWTVGRYIVLKSLYAVKLWNQTQLGRIYSEVNSRGKNKKTTLNKITKGSTRALVAFFEELCWDGQSKGQLWIQNVCFNAWRLALKIGSWVCIMIRSASLKSIETHYTHSLTIHPWGLEDQKCVLWCVSG